MTDNPLTQPLRKTMNDPRFDWTRRKSVRRQLVLAFLLLLVVQPIAMSLLNLIWVPVVLLIPFVGIMGSMNASIRGLSELKRRDLDERELVTRDRVYATLYWPGVFAGVASAVLMGPLSVDGHLAMTGAGLSMFFLAMALPTIWLAWSLPDEPDTD